MRVRGFLLDVEGVLVADKRYQAVAGAVEFIRAVRQAGRPFRLISNNTTDHCTAIIVKLSQAGFDFTLDELHTCTAAAVKRLQATGARRCLVLGTSALREMCAEAGFELAEDADVDAVVVGLDTELTYAQLRTACEAVSTHDAALLALHHNRVYTDEAGRVAPSVGALAAAIEYATQREAVVIGKPSPKYYQQALDELDLPPADVLVVSDDPLSDLAGARRMGMRAAFVLSGKYADAQVVATLPPAERPDVTAGSIGELLTTGAITV